MTPTTRIGLPLETIALEADPTTLTGFIVEGESVPLAELGHHTVTGETTLPWHWRPEIRRACRERYEITDEQWAEMGHQRRRMHLDSYRLWCETEALKETYDLPNPDSRYEAGVIARSGR